MKLRPAVCALLFFLAAFLFTSPASAQAAPEKQKIICDHAAPPRGMHYVCKSQCDCHLEGKLKNDDDGIAPPPGPPSTEAGRDASDNSVCRRAVREFVVHQYPREASLNRISGSYQLQ